MPSDKIERLIEQSLTSLTKQISLSDKKYTDDELEKLINDKFRQTFIQDHPECFIPINSLTRGIRPFFPICNRDGAKDPNMIKIAKQMAEKLFGHHDIDQNHLMKMHTMMIMMMKKMGTGNGPI